MLYYIQVFLLLSMRTTQKQIERDILLFQEPVAKIYQEFLRLQLL